MATQTRNPTSDVSFTGTWTAAPRWSAVDDHPDSGNPIADGITHGTATPGEGLFGFSAFTVPADSTAISVQVIYYDFKNGGPACNLQARIRCNDTTGQDSPGGTHNPGNGNANIALRTDDYGATNPKSGVAWTVDDVNGVGANGLTAFGVVSTDANPSITISSIIVQVTFTPNNRARTSWAEMEVPDVPARRARASWAEFETPDVSHRARISWAELELPNFNKQARISWAEFEVPVFGRQTRVSWAEFEVPDFVRRLRVSWSELEVPNISGEESATSHSLLRRWRTKRG
ncbi:MAG TPA: hypothetical protein VI750_14680 [Pyrinomonadaceae bacterium]|nr:hypothetical protein [Pyrinomonadaceae bacterium]